MGSMKKDAWQMMKYKRPWMRENTHKGKIVGRKMRMRETECIDKEKKSRKSIKEAKE